MTKIIIALVLLAISLFIAACGSSSGGSAGKVIKSGSAGNNLTVSLSNADGILRKGQQEIFLSFTDAGGKPVDVGAVSFNNFMPAMGTMPAMNHAATLTTTGTPGVYRGKVDVDASGEWQSQIAYEGPAGNGKTSLSVTAQ
ncbi:MAG: FixH family protein [Acidobacteriota bacterium]